MEKQKMSYWKDFFTSTFQKRNQNNVVQFPGKENREFTKQKKNLAGLVVELEKGSQVRCGIYSHSTTKN